MSAEECKEEQIGEIEALESIYPDELSGKVKKSFSCFEQTALSFITHNIRSFSHLSFGNRAFPRIHGCSQITRDIR